MPLAAPRALDARVTGTAALLLGGLAWMVASALARPFRGDSAWWNAFGDAIGHMAIVIAVSQAVVIHLPRWSAGRRFGAGCAAVTLYWAWLVWSTVWRNEAVVFQYFGTLILGAALSLLSWIPVLLFAPATELAVRLRDAPERALSWASAWLALMALAATVLASRSGQRAVLLTMAFSAPAFAAVAWVALRARRQRAWLARVYAGDEAGWEVRPGEGADDLPKLGSASAILLRVAATDAGYRSDARGRAEPVAHVPERFDEAERILRGRERAALWIAAVVGALVALRAAWLCFV